MHYYEFSPIMALALPVMLSKIIMVKIFSAAVLLYSAILKCSQFEQKIRNDELSVHVATIHYCKNIT